MCIMVLAVMRATVRRPRRAHAHRVFADRDRHAKRWAQLHADRMHRIEQRGVLSRCSHSRHPVSRQLDVFDRCNRRCCDIGDRLSHSHARRCRRVEHRQRRAFANGKSLAERADEIAQGYGAISHRHLPRPDHLLTRGEATDKAIANGDEECFVGNRRVLQHAIRRIAQLDFCRVECRHWGRFT